MKKVFLNKCLTLISRGNEDISREELEKIRYGLEAIYLTFTKFFFIALICAYLNLLKELIIFTIFYNIIRTFAGGLHASKSYICLIVSSLIFIVIPKLSLILQLNIIVKSCICVLIFIMITLYAPADTHKRPLLNLKKRRRSKLMSIIITVTYIVLIFSLKEPFMSNVILLSLLTEVVLILPITYKVFNLPYRNYKSYCYKGNT